MSRPERVAEIKAEHTHRLTAEMDRRPNKRLLDVFDELVAGNEFEEKGCLICEL
jgi:hypothetical protein